jgi:hypothetical protein
MIKITIIIITDPRRITPLLSVLTIKPIMILPNISPDQNKETKLEESL